MQGAVLLHHLLAATVYLPLVHPVVACSVQQSLKPLPHVLQWAAASRDFARTLPKRIQSANQDVAALLQEILALLRDKAVQAGSWVAFAVNHPTAAAGECLWAAVHQGPINFAGKHLSTQEVPCSPAA